MIDGKWEYFAYRCRPLQLRLRWSGSVIAILVLIWNFAPLACDSEADDYEDATDACWDWEKGL